MSHQPLRKENNCLNCGTEVHGRFCHVCGQENIVTHQNFLSLAQHFIFDVLHFDGKFFHTLLYIFTKPGFVANQYVIGKRMSFLDPIRMYLFTSAVFFLVFFSIGGIKINPGNWRGNLDADDRKEMIEEYEKGLVKKPNDSVAQKRIAILKDTTKPINLDSLGWEDAEMTFGKENYSSLHSYDSVQASLPDSAKDNWLASRLTRQGLRIKEKYGDSGEVANIYLETFLHKLPYLLFISLPFFALVLKMLYKRRKNFYYSDHAVFTLYHYIFSFILLLLIFGVGGLHKWSGWTIFRWLLALLIVAWPVYLLLEMKNFYRQGWGKTLGKFLLLNLAGFIILLLLFLIFLVFSVFQI